MRFHMTEKIYIPPKTISREVAQHIGERIFNGEFKYGDQLKVLQLVEEYGVSQTSIREALQVLQNSYLVEYIPRRGTFVTFQKEEGEEAVILSAKHRLWSLATIEAANRIKSDSDLYATFIQLIDELIDSFDIDAEKAENALDEFNRFILKNCGSNYLIQLITTIESQIKITRFRDFFNTKNGLETSKKYYTRIKEAVENGTPQSIDSLDILSSLFPKNNQ